MPNWINRVAKLRASVPYDPEVEADTGTLNSDGSINQDPTDTLAHPYIWVRPLGSRGAVRAVNLMVRDDLADIPVTIAYHRPTKEWHVLRVSASRASTKLGNATAWANTVRRPGDLVREIVPGRDFKPGRVRGATSGGLVLMAEAFWYVDSAGSPKLWRGETSGTVTVSAPAASGGVNTHRWTVIDLNPDATTPALVATNGTAQLVTLPLVEADIEDIALTSGYVRLAAVKVQTGDTTLTEDDFVDLRFHFGASTIASTSGALMLDDDAALMLDDDGNIMYDNGA